MKKQVVRSFLVMFLLTAVVSAPSAMAADDGDAMDRIGSMMKQLSKLEVSGYVQARYEIGEAGSDTLGFPSVGAVPKSNNTDRFYIRRARFKVKYSASKTSSGVIYVDAGADRDAKVIEAYVTMTEPWTGEYRHTLNVGLVTVPFGFDNVYSSSRRELPERSMAQNRLFPGERDRGLYIQSRWLDPFTTTVGVFNGGGVKDPLFPDTDPTAGKDWLIGGRYHENDIRFGVTWYQGEAVVPQLDPRADLMIDRTRLGLDGEIGFEFPNVGHSKVRAEWYVGENLNPDSLSALIVGGVLAPSANRAHLATDFTGGYVMVVQNFGDKLQGVGRYGLFDPNTDLDHDQFERIGLGLNYFWDKNTRITLSYDIPRTDEASGTGFVDPEDNLWTAQFQYKF